MAPTKFDEFELPDGSYSVWDVQDYIKYIIKKHEILPINPPIHIYISSINNRFMLKIKYVCKLELQTPKTMKLLDNR